jgi:hypothetical protein
MRLDSVRLSETMERLTEFWLSTSTAQAQAAEFLGDGFEGIGWQVERREAPCRGTRAALLRAARLLHPAELVAPLIVARPTGSPPPRRRVVLLSNLGPLAPVSRPAGYLLGLAVLCVIGHLLRPRIGWPLAVLFVGIGVLLLLVVALSRSATRSRADWGRERSSEAAGPALLLEMARSWPKGWLERFEPVMVAAGSNRCGFAGLQETERLIQDEWPREPTLLIALIAPGVATDLLISGRPSELLSRALDAARSLWIPARASKPSHAIAIGRGRPDAIQYLLLCSSVAGDVTPSSVDTAALARAAQLVTEIALRWSKKQEEAVGQVKQV